MKWSRSGRQKVKLYNRLTQIKRKDQEPARLVDGFQGDKRHSTRLTRHPQGLFSTSPPDRRTRQAWQLTKRAAWPEGVLVWLVWLAWLVWPPVTTRHHPTHLYAKATPVPHVDGACRADSELPGFPWLHSSWRSYLWAEVDIDWRRKTKTEWRGKKREICGRKNKKIEEEKPFIFAWNQLSMMIFLVNPDWADSAC